MSAPLSGNTLDNPVPQPPRLLRAAVLICRGAARLGEAATALEQARKDIEAAREGLDPGQLWGHNSLRAAVLLQLLEARTSTERLLALARDAERLASPAPGGANLHVPPGHCRLCTRALRTEADVKRGWHLNCPDAAAKEGGAS